MKLLKFLHRWVGFPVGIVFILIIATGVINGSKDLFYLFKDYQQSYQPTSLVQDATALEFITEAHPDAFQILLPSESRPFYQARGRGEQSTYSIEPFELIDQRDIRGGFFSTNLSLHRNLLLGGDPVLFSWSGRDLVAWISLICFALSLIGLYIWLPMFKSFRLRNAWPDNSQRSSLQKAHINASVIVFVPIVILALTGAGITYNAIYADILGAERQSQQGIYAQPVKLQADWLSWLQAAKTAMPEGELQRISLPRQRRMPPKSGAQQGNKAGQSHNHNHGHSHDHGKKTAQVNLRSLVQFCFHTDADWFGLAGSKVYLDKKKSALVGASYFKEKSVSQQIFELMVPLHTGHGLTKTYLFFLLCPLFFSIAMVYFGVWGFWKKTNKFAKLKQYKEQLFSGLKTLLGKNKDAADESLAAAQAIKIIYASQTGNGEAIAEDLFKHYRQQGLPVGLLNVDQVSQERLAKEKFVIFIASTQGDGDVADDAESLFYELEELQANDSLKNLRYSILSLGDSSYDQFCQAGKTFDQLFQEQGAQQLIARQDCDIDYEDQVQSWSTDLLAVLKSQTDLQLSQLSREHELSNDDLTATIYDKKNPYQQAILRSNKKLSGENSNKDVRHIEIDLQGSGLQYQAGDLLGLYFKNKASLVNEIISTCKLDSTMAFSELTNHYELTLVHPGFVEKYAAFAGHEALSKIAADADQIKHYMTGRQVVDIVKDYPATLSFEQFKTCLRKLTPRMYSIASSSLVDENIVALTVRIVRYHSHDRDHHGAATGYLADSIKEGDQLSVFIEENKHFKLPTDPTADIIMIGPGTGIAPFRGFLAERQAKAETGKNWLFFGEQTSSDDFHYQQELQAHQQSGLLNKLSLAFSRDQQEKVYVHHLIKQQAAEVYAWFESGAYVYVCGDAFHMAVDVEQALLDLIQHQGQSTAEEAKAYLMAMKKAKRYQRDVY